MSVSLESLRFPVSYVQLVEQISVLQGRNFNELVENFLKVDVLSLDDPQALIDGVQFGKILDVVSDFINKNEQAQSQFIKFFPVTTHGYVGLVAITAATIAQAIEMAENYSYQAMPAFEATHHIDNDLFTLRIKALADFGENNALLTELVLYAWKSIITFSEIPFEKITISFTHKNLCLTDFHSYYPHSKLNLAAKSNSLSFPAELLNLPISTANSITMKLVKQELENKKARLDRINTLSSKISMMINERIRSNHSVELADIAAELKLSGRTLSRRLQEENTSFKTLHSACRLILAKSLLVESQQSISQIAFALGFLNEASFSRYFKQQTDQSPVHYRNESG